MRRTPSPPLPPLLTTTLALSVLIGISVVSAEAQSAAGGVSNQPRPCRGVGQEYERFKETTKYTLAPRTLSDEPSLALSIETTLGGEPRRSGGSGEIVPPSVRLIFLHRVRGGEFLGQVEAVFLLDGEKRIVKSRVQVRRGLGGQAVEALHLILLPAEFEQIARSGIVQVRLQSPLGTGLEFTLNEDEREAVQDFADCLPGAGEEEDQ